MKTQRAATHRPRRKRRASDETATLGGEHEAAPALAPDRSMELLRHPQVGSAAREAALRGLQRAVGNGGVERVVAPSDATEVVQRDGKRETADPVRVEEERRKKQAAEAETPVGERLASTSREVIMHYAANHLRTLENFALRELVRAWRESPGGVITAGAILGTAGITYLAGTRKDLPEITIPLDFLASRIPALRGAEVSLDLSGPITRPEGFQIGITLRESAPHTQKSTRRGSGTPFTPRMYVRQSDIVTDGPEVGDEILISGRVPVPMGISAADIAATIAAIRDGSIEVAIGGTPALRANILNVTDSFQPDRFGLRSPPPNRHLLVRLRSSVPPMFHQRPEIIDLRSVDVRINGVHSESTASVRVRIRPFPAAD